MKTHTTNLLNLLNSGKAYRAELLTITCGNGVVIRLCDGDRSITVSGNTYLTSPRFERDALTEQVGVKASDLNIKLFATPADVVGSLPFTQLAAMQILDGALVSLQTSYGATYGDTSVGLINRFVGYVSEVQPTRLEVDLVVKNKLEYLSRQVPYNFWQPVCVHRLYDSGCTLVESSFAVSGTVSGGSTASILNTNLTQADIYFSLGKVVFTSGANVGFVRTIKSFAHTSGVVTLMSPLPFTPATSDTFTAYPGCDKSQGTGGCGKFSNVANFKATPFVPAPEALFG